MLSGCSLVRLKCSSGGREIGGSNPLIPTKGLPAGGFPGANAWSSALAELLSHPDNNKD